MGLRERMLLATCAFVASLRAPTRLALGDRLGDLLRWLPTRAQRVTRRNLKIVAPQLPLDFRAVMQAHGRGILDTLKIWGSEPAKLLNEIEQIDGAEHLSQAIAAGRGVLIAAPHLGAFELLNLYLKSHGTLSILYKPPKQAWLEPFLNAQRARSGAHPIPASASGVRNLLKALKRGEMVGILPDQQPKLGDGEFAPFFGVDAFTMTLFCRLARASGARVLFGFAERSASSYRIHIRPAAAALSSEELAQAVAALNADVEALVRCAPLQYQWSYKRYSIRPASASERIYP